MLQHDPNNGQTHDEAVPQYERMLQHDPNDGQTLNEAVPQYEHGKSLVQGTLRFKDVSLI